MSADQSITKVVESIIDTLSDAVSQLILLVIAFQEQNAAPPPQLPPAAKEVDKTARILVDVAKNLAEEEYTEYPDIKKEIDDAANEVERSSTALIRAIDELVKGSDRKRGWDNLVDACKVISGKTILLLQIVYGAELKRLFALQEQAKKALDKLDTKRAKRNPQEFADEVGEIATQANQLGEYIKNKAQDEESPIRKKELEDHGKALEKDSQDFLDKANEFLGDLDNPKLEKDYEDAKKRLLDTMAKAMEPVKEIQREHLQNTGGLRVKETPVTVQRAELGGPSSHRATEHPHRSTYPDYLKDLFGAADAALAALANLKFDMDRGDVPKTDKDFKDLDTDSKPRLLKAAKAAADREERPQQKKNILQLLDDIEKGIPAAKQPTHDSAAHPDDKPKRKAADDKLDNIENAIIKLLDAAAPGEGLVSLAEQLKDNIKDAGEAAKKDDPHTLATAANQAGKRKGKLADQAKAAAEKINNPDTKRSLLDALDDLDRLLPQHLEKAKNTLKDPSDSKKRDLDNLTRTLR